MASGFPTNARGRAPAAHDNVVYLHELYRDPPPPPQQQPLGSRELMFFFGALKWCILLLIAIASFLLVVWIVFHPNFPLLSVASAAMSSFKITTTAATGECNITLVLTNPNRHLSTVYEHMEISLLYASQKVLLSEIQQPLIVQPKRTQITFQTNLSFSGINPGSTVLTAMKQDLDRGSLGLGIKISAVLKYRNGKWKTKSRFMRAYCGGVSFGFTSIDRPGESSAGNKFWICISDCETSWFVNPNKRIVFDELDLLLWNVNKFYYSFTKRGGWKMSSWVEAATRTKLRQLRKARR